MAYKILPTSNYISIDFVHETELRVSFTPNSHFFAEPISWKPGSSKDCKSKASTKSFLKQRHRLKHASERSVNTTKPSQSHITCPLAACHWFRSEQVSVLWPAHAHFAYQEWRDATRNSNHNSAKAFKRTTLFGETETLGKNLHHPSGESLLSFLKKQHWRSISATLNNWQQWFQSTKGEVTSELLSTF